MMYENVGVCVCVLRVCMRVCIDAYRVIQSKCR
jgi:hypothetical protein